MASVEMVHNAIEHSCASDAIDKNKNTDREKFSLACSANLF